MNIVLVAAIDLITQLNITTFRSLIQNYQTSNWHVFILSIVSQKDVLLDFILKWWSQINVFEAAV